MQAVSSPNRSRPPLSASNGQSSTSLGGGAVLFGSSPLQGLLEVSGVDPNKKQEQRRRKKGILSRVLIAAPLLSLVIWGIYPASSVIRQIDNRWREGVALESVLLDNPSAPAGDAPAGNKKDKPAASNGSAAKTPAKNQPATDPAAGNTSEPVTDVILPPEEQGGEPIVIPGTGETGDTPATLTTEQLITFLNSHRRLNIPAPLLVNMAKAKLVREVLITNPLTREGIVILINGRELQTKLDDKVQTTLIDKHKIPVNKPFLSWMNIAPLEALLVSALLTGAAAQVLTRDDKIHGKVNKDDKRRIDINDLGRFILAHKLDTSDEPITLEDIERQRKYPWLSDNRKPLTRDQLKKQLAVLWAGYFSERRFYEEKNLSITSMNISDKVSEIAGLAVSKLDAAGIFGRYHPQELSDELKRRVEEETKKLAEEAATLAEETLNTYPLERLEVLLEARNKFNRRPLDKEDTLLILDQGKSIKEIRSSRRRAMVRSPKKLLQQLPFFNRSGE